MHSFKEYQEAAWQTAQFLDKESNLLYPIMGVAGEAGELCDKVKKYWRNLNIPADQLLYKLSDEQIDEIIKEMGDLLWYCAAVATVLRIELSDIAQINIDKLADRQKRRVIQSEGDNR